MVLSRVDGMTRSKGVWSSRRDRDAARPTRTNRDERRSGGPVGHAGGGIMLRLFYVGLLADAAQKDHRTG